MRHTLLCLTAILAIHVAGPLANADEPKAKAPSTKGLDLFNKQIKPALIAECYECHSQKGDSIEGGLELDSPAGLARGGDTGPILVAHDVKKSRLIQMLRHEGEASGMPPEHKLSAKVIAAFEEWIRLGAPDSRKETGPTMKEQRMEEGLGHWAFLPPKSVEPRPVKQTAWPRDAAIDSFILAQIEAKGMQPVADANRRTLVRRVYFDLIGLPPTPAEVEEFVSDDSPDALAQLVDRLLDSPRFGERWGRHWLDVVRYAESSGKEFNFTYPHAWPYRDYVIDAFNDDKPYDVFIREQIAGDLLPATPGESPAAVQARHIAPSLLAFGPKRHNSSGVEYQMDIVDDQINTVFRATLAMTVACARCHDHKFDPIPTKDYYALAGIFLSTEPLYGTIKQKYSNNPTKLLPIGANAQARHDAAEDHTKQLAAAQKLLAAKQAELKKTAEVEKLAAAKKADLDKRVAASVAVNAAGGEAAADSPPQAEIDNAAAELAKAVNRTVALKAELAKQKTLVAKLEKSKPQRPHYAMSARDRAKPADTKIAIRGDFRTRGEVAPRGFLSAVSVPDAPQIDANRSGRLELAKWITRAENPLTARVMVNRIWHHLFGRGLVSTVDNFGVIGKQPSHPELLDNLALRFIDQGWSVKRMIRAIVLSRAYQLSSTTSKQNMAIDPDNRLFWRATPRRLEAEAIRDAMLAVSGQLNLERPNGSTVTALGDQLVRAIPTEKIQPPSSHRSVYLPVVRDYVPELFDLFDFPSPSLVSGRRAVTNVPSQALYLRNSKFVAQQTQHAARRLLAAKEAKTDAERVELAMRWALARSPSDVERTAALQLVAQARQAKGTETDSEVNAWVAWFHTLFTTAEFRYLVDIN